MLGTSAAISTWNWTRDKQIKIYRNSFLLLTKRFSKQVDVTLYLCDKSKVEIKIENGCLLYPKTASQTVDFNENFVVG